MRYGRATGCVALLAAPAVAPAAAQVEDDPGVARRYDDPAFARRFEAPRAPAGAPAEYSTPALAAAVSPEPLPADAPLLHLSIGAGYASPVEDPDLREGWGAALWLGAGRSAGGELRASFSWHHYVDELDPLGVDFIDGDITPGAFWAFVPDLPGREMTAWVSAGFGPYWMTGLNGVTWSLGVRGGGGVEWRASRHVGVRVEAQYHLFHVAEIGGETYYDRRSLQKVGTVDRFELPVSLAFHL